MKADLSASNRLYRGEVSDFMEAMDCVVQMCRQEKALGVDGQGESLGDDLNSDLDSYAAAARKCRLDYFQRIRVRLHELERQLKEELAKEWVATGDEDMKRIGECLVAEDYSELAI